MTPSTPVSKRWIFPFYAKDQFFGQKFGSFHWVKKYFKFGAKLKLLLIHFQFFKPFSNWTNFSVLWCNTIVENIWRWWASNSDSLVTELTALPYQCVIRISRQCDQIWQNYTSLAKCYKKLLPFWRVWFVFGNFFMPLDKFSLL